jgi:hypothetical protein
MRRITMLVLLPAAAWAWDPELTPQAKASPLAGQWLTVSSSMLFGGVQQAGETLHVDWVSRFERVPASVPHAARGRHLQLLGQVEYFGSGLPAAGSMMLILATRATAAVLGAIGGVALTVALQALAWAHLRESYREVLEAVRIYNTALNDTLPPDQQLDLGEFGLPPAPPTMVLATF